MLRGVYCPASLCTDLELRARAATLVLPDHVVVSDHSAAWLHGVDTHEPGTLDVPPPLYVVSRRGHEATRRAGIVASQRDLLDEEITEVNGVRATTPLRTAADLACLRGRSAALAVLDAFMRNHEVTHAQYGRMIARFTGRRGVRQFRELAPRATPLAESPGESWTRGAILDAGLPSPNPQVWVTLDGFGAVRLDLAYPLLKIAVEYDGEAWHSSAEQREADRRRRAALRDAGWLVIVVRKGDLAGEALDAWIGKLSRAVHEREPQHGRRYPIPARDYRPYFRTR